MASNMQSLMK
jgi:hypothetical protein